MALLEDDPSVTYEGRIAYVDEESLKEKLLLDTKQESLEKAKKKGVRLKEKVCLLTRDLQAMEEVLPVKDGLVSEKMKNLIDVEHHSAETEVSKVNVSKERILSKENFTADGSVSENVGKKEPVHVEAVSYIHNKELKVADKSESITAYNGHSALKIVQEKVKTRPKKAGVDLKKQVLPVKNDKVLTLNEEVVVKMPEPETLDGEKKVTVTSSKKVVKNTRMKKMKAAVYPGDVVRTNYGKKKTIRENVLIEVSKEVPEKECADYQDRPEDGEEMKTGVKVVKKVAKKISEGKAVHERKEVLKMYEKSSDRGRCPKVSVVKKVCKSDKEPKTEAQDIASSVEPEHEKDSNSDDDGINIIIPSIEEQRKFADVASHIARLQRFQAAMDKVGLGDALWKCYVLDYKQVWASAWTSTQQEPEGAARIGCRYGERKKQVHDCRSREWHGEQDKE